LTKALLVSSSHFLPHFVEVEAMILQKVDLFSSILKQISSSLASKHCKGHLSSETVTSHEEI
jgi:hypothetical protein